MQTTVRGNNTRTRKAVRKRRKRLTTQQKLARLFLAVSLVVGVFTITNTVISKIVVPVGKTIIKELTTTTRDELMSYELKEMPTARFENKYFYDFIGNLEIASEYDLRDLLAFVMEVNDMESTDEFYERGSLLVPVPSK